MKQTILNRRVLEFDPLDPKGLVCLGHYRYKKMDKHLREHIHQDIMEICYLESGYQTYVVGEEAYHLKGGDVFLTFPNETHGTGEFVEEKGSLYWFQIQTLKMDNFLGLPKIESDYFLHELNDLQSRHFKAVGIWKETFENIFALSEKKDMAYKNIRLRQLAIDLLLNCVESSRQSGDLKNDCDMEKALVFIHKNVEKTISIKDVADVCFLSESHFKAKFKNTMGVSPQDYIQRNKIEKSKELIRLNKWSLTEIAMLLGFSSSQYFSSVFKKYTGQKPSEF